MDPAGDKLRAAWSEFCPLGYRDPESVSNSDDCHGGMLLASRSEES